MALVNVTNVVVLDNPSPFFNPFQFEISFEALAPLEDDLEWKIIYVGSAESEEYDQVLDAILVGPIPVGLNKFVFQANPPDIQKIPNGDILGVTVVLITCSYRDQEFIRVGYYVNNDYKDEALRENPPKDIEYQQVYREILASQPRVTRFPIEWDSPTAQPVNEGMMQPEQQLPQDMAANGGQYYPVAHGNAGVEVMQTS
eukprot:Colp12_sorted_trinity150504_noHs@26490